MCEKRRLFFPRIKNRQRMERISETWLWNVHLFCFQFLEKKKKWHRGQNVRQMSFVPFWKKWQKTIHANHVFSCPVSVCGDVSYTWPTVCYLCRFTLCVCDLLPKTVGPQYHRVRTPPWSGGPWKFTVFWSSVLGCSAAAEKWSYEGRSFVHGHCHRGCRVLGSSKPPPPPTWQDDIMYSTALVDAGVKKMGWKMMIFSLAGAFLLTQQVGWDFMGQVVGFRHFCCLLGES